MIPDIGIAAGVELSIDGQNSKDREATLRMAWQEWIKPRILTPAFSIPAFTGAGTAAVRVGEGPNQMRQWTVKRLVVDLAIAVGVAEPAANTVTVFLYSDTTGLSHVTPTLLPSTQLRFRATNLPVLQTWTDEQNVIFGPEDLVVVVNTTAAVAAISGQAQVIDEPMYVLDFETWLNTITE